jgi:hypothetical protein
MPSKPPRKKAGPAAEPAEIYAKLRNQIFKLNPKEVGILQTRGTPNVWGLLIETGYPEAVVTLVSLADGTTSLYFSNGGGMIGGGEHATVARSTKAFIAAAEKYYRQMDLTEAFPLLTVGRVRFYVLTFSGVLTLDVDENKLGDGKHALSPLFYSGQDVIAQFRAVQEQKK